MSGNNSNTATSFQGEVVLRYSDGSGEELEWSAGKCQGGRATSGVPRIAMCVGPGAAYSVHLGDIVYIAECHDRV